MDEVSSLRQALSESEKKVADLEAEVERLRRASRGAPAQSYAVAANVLVISGSWEFHNVEKVSLERILASNMTRSYTGEADTPVVQGAGRFDWGTAQPNFPRQDSTPDGVGGESPLAPVAPSQVNVSKRMQPPPINVGRPRLDPNAIMSRSTLDTFQKLWAQGMSPSAPMTAESVKVYIVSSFMKGGCRHEPKDKEGFGRALLHLCALVEPIVLRQPMHVDVPAPCYVFGDIHGNLEDLVKFSSNLMNFWDMNYTPYSFLFLGDYVDRGDFSVECVAYLFALMALSPEKVVMLRGNHEDKLVNGDVGLYGETTFKYQCETVFGSILGNEVWNRVNKVFAMLPLSAAIDHSIFCAHGGIPRPPRVVKEGGGGDPRIAMLRDPSFPRFDSFFDIPVADEDPYLTSCRQLALDMSWADPSDDDMFLDKNGFGMNPRGQGIILFGGRAVDDFLGATGYTHVFRAHQEKADGIKVSKNARVITIFSTSDYVGHQNCAGVVYVGGGKIRMIMKKAF